jgi:hypothetical protein
MAAFAVLARSPDGSVSVVIGPLPSVGAVIATTREIAAAGWIPQSTRQLWSVAHFREHARRGRRRPGE